MEPVTALLLGWWRVVRGWLKPLAGIVAMLLAMFGYHKVKVSQARRHGKKEERKAVEEAVTSHRANVANSVEEELSKVREAAARREEDTSRDALDNDW